MYIYVGSRASGLKIGPLLSYVLQIAPKSSTIYKLTGGLASWLAQHYTSIVSKQHSEFHDIQIDRWTPRMAG